MAKKKASPIIQNWQGAQILSDDLYLAYHEESKDAAQQRIWTFCEAIIIDSMDFVIFKYVPILIKMKEKKGIMGTGKQKASRCINEIIGYYGKKRDKCSYLILIGSFRSLKTVITLRPFDYAPWL